MSETYKKVAHKFEEGQVLQNNNRSWYKVVQVKSQSEVLFERTSDKECVWATNPKMFEKYTDENGKELVLEWASGRYVTNPHKYKPLTTTYLIENIVTKEVNELSCTWDLVIGSIHEWLGLEGFWRVLERKG